MTGSLLAAALLLAPPAPTAERVADAVRPYLEAHPYAAVTVGVSTPAGRAVHGFGSVRPPGEPPAAPDGRTIYEIGSVTKAFTGTVLARLIAEGVVNEEDPAASHLPPDLAPPVWTDDDGVPRPITLRQLATHTGGLPVQPTGIGLFAAFTDEPGDPYGAYRRRYLARSLRAMTAREPGEHAYSNLGVGLLGHALANADSGDPLAMPELFAARLTRPLGLTDTAFALSEAQRDRFPRLYTGGGDPAAPWTFATLGACGGLRSTADDLLTFADAGLGRGPDGGEPFAAACREATEPRATVREGMTVGLCWMTLTPAGGGDPIVWHNGGTGGSRSFFAVRPKSGVAVVVLANCAASVDRIGMRLIGAK